MRAALITAFREPLEVRDVPDPVAPPRGVVLRVEASGICRSDWHAWVGHERLPALPHVPGHEMAGTVEEAGAEVERWEPGARVTVPFSIGCGECRSCLDGQLQVCDRPFTPGFTHWGSWAELVAIDHADRNLVGLPEGTDPADAAALGCRFVTAFRAVADQGRIAPGDWLAVHGCGGVGLSAVMIGRALGARVAAVDVAEDKLALAAELGAEAVVNAREIEDAGRAVREATDGGAHVSIDALGSASTLLASLRSLRKRGRHVQVGLLHGPDAAPSIPMEPVIMRELELYGSHGMPATDYPRVLELLASGAADASRLVRRRVALEEATAVLEEMGGFGGIGVTVIDRFGPL